MKLQKMRIYRKTDPNTLYNLGLTHENQVGIIVKACFLNLHQWIF